MDRLRVDVWSDVACPWCYIGKRRLEAVLEGFPNAADVDVVWHSFELDPSAPRSGPDGLTTAEYLSKKYGCSVSEARTMMQRVADTAKSDGLQFNQAHQRPGNTFDAHRLIKLANKHGKQSDMNERLFKAYFTDERTISDKAVLAKIGEEAGLPVDEVTAMLESDLYAKEVREDEAEAKEIGVRGVPFFVFGEKYAVSGAQPKESLLAVLEKACE